MGEGPGGGPPVNLAYLSLGSNIQPERNLPRAVRLLAEVGEVRRVSHVYQTAPVGSKAQPDFLNAAVLLRTTLEAEELKGHLAGIERELKRERTADKNAPRTMDIDISLFNREILTSGRSMPRSSGHSQIPHPAVLIYAHVAVPLADLDPDYLHPVTGESLGAIAARLSGGAPVRVRDELRLGAPLSSE